MNLNKQMQKNQHSKTKKNRHSKTKKKKKKFKKNTTNPPTFPYPSLGVYGRAAYGYGFAKGDIICMDGYGGCGGHGRGCCG